jgi:hypothetical protein
LWCLTFFYRNTPIGCGTQAVLINACFLGKDPLTMEKWVQFGWEGDLMHRFIHRNWGESFVNIFLDLSVDIFHSFSPLEFLESEQF